MATRNSRANRPASETPDEHAPAVDATSKDARAKAPETNESLVVTNTDIDVPLVEKDAPGAHADAVANRDDTPSPESGDDHEKGQADRLGQVAPVTVQVEHHVGGLLKAAQSVPNTNPAPLEPLAPGAHRDAHTSAQSPAPQTGDDHAKGQASRWGQVAPTGAVYKIPGQENPNGAPVATPILDEARGAHADAVANSPSARTGEDYGAGQEFRMGQVAILDGAIPHGATVAGLGSINTSPAPSSARLDPPTQQTSATDTTPHKPRQADVGIALAQQQAGLIIDAATNTTPVPANMFRPYTAAGDAQVVQVRLLQKGFIGRQPVTQLIFAPGQVISGAQAALLKARATRQAASS